MIDIAKHALDIDQFAEAIEKTKTRFAKDETQRKSIWHSPEEIPEKSDGVEIVYLQRTDGELCIDSLYFYSSIEEWKPFVLRKGLEKWIYLDDLEAL